VAALGSQAILAGDVLYERALATRVLPWLQRAAAGGATVLLGDPGRPYALVERFTVLAQYRVPTSQALENAPVKRVSVVRVPAEDAS